MTVCGSQQQLAERMKLARKEAFDYTKAVNICMDISEQGIERKRKKEPEKAADETRTKRLKLCFIGGDCRQRYAAQTLAASYAVCATGDVWHSASHLVKVYENPQKALYDADGIVLPLPVAQAEDVFPFDQLAEQAKQKKIPMIGGMFSSYEKDVATALGVRIFDYFSDESFLLANAVITAEGAVSLAMNVLEETLLFAPCAVLGFGRIGTALSRRLSVLGSRVTVFARREEALEKAKLLGYQAERLLGEEQKQFSASYRVIFNTVPKRILSPELLLSLPSGTVLIELASRPGGFDPDIAQQCDLRVIDGRGLPGKYAPLSAGKALADAILRIMEREEII